MTIRWPKKWESNENRNINYFLVPGYLQIDYENACRKNGISVHKRLEEIMRADLENLSRKESRIEERKRKITALQKEIELIENESSMIMANTEVLKKVDDKLKEMAIRQMSYRWIYSIVDALAKKYRLSFNEMLEVFCMRTKEHIQNHEIRKKLLFELKFVGDQAKNGALTEEQMLATFPLELEVKA